jgi:hypothetical protein
MALVESTGVRTVGFGAEVFGAASRGFTALAALRLALADLATFFRTTFFVAFPLVLFRAIQGLLFLLSSRPIRRNEPAGNVHWPAPSHLFASLSPLGNGPRGARVVGPASSTHGPDRAMHPAVSAFIGDPLALFPELPPCPTCGTGLLLPFSDYGPEAGAAVVFKAWACSNPSCGFCLRIDKGGVSYGRRLRQGEK